MAFGFFIDLKIGSKTLRVDADAVKNAASDVASAINGGFHVKYHADTVDDAFSMGTLAEAAGDVVAFLQTTLEFVDPSGLPFDISNTIKSITGKGPLASIGNAIVNDAELRITDLEIDTTMSPVSFKFGLAVVLTGVSLTTPPIGINAFGLVISR